MADSKTVAKAVYELIKEGQEKEEVANKLYGFVKEYGFEDRLESIFFHLNELIKSDKEKNNAYVEVAHKIPEALLERIKSIVGIKEGANMIVSVDEGLLGGFRADYNGRIYDASLKTVANKLKEEIKK